MYKIKNWFKFLNESVIDDVEYLTAYQWEDIWVKLRRLNKSFSLPNIYSEDDGLFIFGGLFFGYNSETGNLFIPAQNLSDWNKDPNKAYDVLCNYRDRLIDIFENSGLDIELECKSDFEMTIKKKS
jgi:hypothetical protein